MREHYFHSPVQQVESPAQTLFRHLGLEKSIKAVRARREYLYGARAAQTFTHDEVGWIIMLESLHIPLAEFASVVKAGIEKALEA
jgi:hypothetical protein